MQDRIPPHSDDAEKSVLGACMLSKDALLDVTDVVRAGDFYSSMHREIFTAITELQQKGNPVDTLTVCEELTRRGALELAGGASYVASLASAVPSTANAKEYGKMVAERAVLRSLIKASDDVIAKCYAGDAETDAILDFAENGIFGISQGRQYNEISPISDILDSYMDTLDEISRNGGAIVGTPSGFADLDKVLNGFQKSDLVIIAARPAMGKTAFALNIAQQAAQKAKASVLIFSLEMSKEQLMQRMVSMESRVDSSKLAKGDLNPKDWDDLNMACDKLSQAKIFIDDNAGNTIMEIKNKCRRKKVEEGLDLVIIDYLQLMQTHGRSENRQQEISALSRSLKLMARELDVPVLVLSQLSRAVESRNDHKPMLSDLRESGSIEQDADIVLFLYRDDYYTKENSAKPGVCDVIIAKNRRGETRTVELTWLAKYTKFADKAGGSFGGQEQQ